MLEGVTKAYETLFDLLSPRIHIQPLDYSSDIIIIETIAIVDVMSVIEFEEAGNLNVFVSNAIDVID